MRIIKKSHNYKYKFIIKFKASKYYLYFCGFNFGFSVGKPTLDEPLYTIRVSLFIVLKCITPLK